jgi:hypothetical protein
MSLVSCGETQIEKLGEKSKTTRKSGVVEAVLKVEEKISKFCELKFHAALRGTCMAGNGLEATNLDDFWCR